MGVVSSDNFYAVRNLGGNPYRGTGIRGHNAFGIYIILCDLGARMIFCPTRGFQREMLPFYGKRCGGLRPE